MSTVLIVDDMPLCLETIAEVLRNEGYTVLCASSGEEALSLLDCEHVDLLLLDVLMPGIDGLAVLSMIRKNYRWCSLPVILLTDAAEEGRVRTAASLGVQGYLLKSHFSVKDLRSRVAKYLAGMDSHVSKSKARRADIRSSNPAKATRSVPAALSASTPNKAKSESEVLNRVRRHLQLKSVPPVLQHVLALANNSRSSINEIVGAVRQDQALAIRVMKIANSSFYMTETRAQNLAEATQRIGLSGLRNATTAILAIDHFTGTSSGGLIPQRFWEHSLATAVLAQTIGETIGIENADELFLAGLLHDVGRLVLSGAFPEEYREVLAAGEEQNLDLVQVEHDTFGLNHSDVTREVLKELKMSDVLVAAAHLHSHRVDELKRAGRDSRNALAVCLANRVAHAALLGDSGSSMLYPLHDAAEALGLSAEFIGLTARAVTDRTRDAELLYACHGDVEFREPLATELAKQTERPVRLAILAGDVAHNPFSLFCDRLGWLAPEDPELALLYVTSPQQMEKCFEELHRLEHRVDARLAVLLASCGESTPPPDHLIAGRPWRLVSLPTRYSAVVQAVCELQGVDSVPEHVV